MARQIRKSLGELRLGEEFVTANQGLHGSVLDWGHVRPSGWWQEKLSLPRPRLSAVLVEISGRQFAASPNLAVYVDANRPHLATSSIPEGRWVKFLKTAQDEENDAA